MVAKFIRLSHAHVNVDYVRIEQDKPYRMCPLTDRHLQNRAFSLIPQFYRDTVHYLVIGVISPS